MSEYIKMVFIWYNFLLINVFVNIKEKLKYKDIVDVICKL